MPGRESISVISRSNPTVSVRMVCILPTLFSAAPWGLRFARLRRAGVGFGRRGRVHTGVGAAAGFQDFVPTARRLPAVVDLRPGGGRYKRRPPGEGSGKPTRQPPPRGGRRTGREGPGWSDEVVEDRPRTHTTQQATNPETHPDPAARRVQNHRNRN